MATREVRRRQQASQEETLPPAAPATAATSSQPQGGAVSPKPSRSSLLTSKGFALLSRYLPWILSFQVLCLILLLLDPFSLSKPKPLGTDRAPPEPNKPLLSIADVENLASRVAANDTVIFLICPHGYEEFAQNWLAVAREHTDLEERFLVLAEDEETYAKLNSTFPSNVVLRMDVKDTFHDLEACHDADQVTLAALRSAYRKVVYAREIMNTGKHVLVCDVTAVWKQNPLRHFQRNEDVFVTLGGVGKAGVEQLLAEYSSQGVMRLQPPLPRGVGKLPPLSDEIIFFQNNVGSWVTVDYWAVVLESMVTKACQAPATSTKTNSSDTYTTGASTSAFITAVGNAIHLTPKPLIGLLPAGTFPPPQVFFEDESWRSLIEKDAVVVRAKLGALDKEHMKSRLKKAGLWKLPGSTLA